LDNDYVVLAAWLTIGLLSYALLAGAIFKAREIASAAGVTDSPPQHAVAGASADAPDDSG